MGAEYSYPSTSTVATKKVPLDMKCSSESLISSIENSSTDVTNRRSRREVIVVVVFFYSCIMNLLPF